MDRKRLTLAVETHPCSRHHAQRAWKSELICDTTHAATDEVGTFPIDTIARVSTGQGIDYPRCDKGASFDGRLERKMGIESNKEGKATHQIMPSSSEREGTNSHEGAAYRRHPCS